MKRSSILRSIGLLSTLAVMAVLHAQQRFVREGDKAYQALAYERATTSYERAAQAGVPDSLFARKLASSYYNLRDLTNAAKWYARAVGAPGATNADLYAYSQTLRASGDYAAADQWLATYRSKAMEDTRGERQKNAATHLKHLVEHPVPGCTVNDLDINTVGAEMGASYMGDRVVFASDRAPDVAEARRHTWNGRPFLDLYSAAVAVDGRLSDAVALSAVNTKYHESNATFSPDKATVYFTRNNYSNGHKGTNASGVVNLTMYRRTLVNGAWVNEQPFPFNSDQYSVGHPCLSADGNTLFFTSDMPGGMGGTDIWSCRKEGTSWAKPVNLGSTVNTEGNEMFPFVDHKGTFFFASDGQQGLGGLDILFCRMNVDGSFSAPKNAGVPINSAHDDFALVLDGTGLKGYLTSDRPGGKGNDDLYSLSLTKPLGPSMRVEGVARDRRTGATLAGTAVELKDAKGKAIANTTVAADGTYSFDLEPESGYTLAAALDRYRPVSEEITTGKEADTTVHRDLRFAWLQDVHLWMHVVNARTKESLDAVTVQAIDVKGGNVDVLGGATDAQGDLRKTVKGFAVGDSLVFRVRLTRQGFFPKKGLFLYTVNDSGEVAMHETMDLAMEPIEVGAEVGQAISVAPIYFDVGKSGIRADAAIELDKVVNVMNENPTMEIELGSHTDSRGSDRANLILSEKRAKSSAAYIISKGIEKRRIKGKGYGETRLLNDCHNGAECTEEQHQMNRRTEFIIVRM